ncbi:hypothetical protein BJ741DRAFT_609980 [Chytriomyces cf. hyalinus JEL632]|nr:hypothetical protein BJ741DRAFT_609980 [Chytriomyces cf. hyalinus JEL632]
MSKPATSVTRPSDSATAIPPLTKEQLVLVSLPSPESTRKQVLSNPAKTKSTLSESESDTAAAAPIAPISLKRKVSNARVSETVVPESPPSHSQNKEANTPPPTLKRAFDGFDTSDESEVGALDGRLRRRRRLASSWLASTPQTTKQRSKHASTKQVAIVTVAESPAPTVGPQSPERSNTHAAAATASTPPKKQKSDLGSSKVEIPPVSPMRKLPDQTAAPIVKPITRSRVKITPILETGLDPFDSDNEEPAAKAVRMTPSKKRSAPSEDPFEASGPPPPAPRKKRAYFKSLDEISRKVEPTSPVRKGDKGKRGSAADFWGV